MQKIATDEIDPYEVNEFQSQIIGQCNASTQFGGLAHSIAELSTVEIF